ncbi:homoserine kinase [Fictibacillus phosphorivorans]|uniref:homoserine kinase n=1 Tax=Fictibacillus phosphorivorans TaxID=1221500 RepID=UPI00204197BE|nr:homoserine kinase [Fictibacillus phosphorivorans]MCM3718224.1 homoserine kinase [Fictibacillus phosphorivorans]MCM3775909.1 homoserine kinase [Fictibacillus phosphorivorans]
MNFDAFSIHVPASTANLGPGFDSVGLALNRYLSVHVQPASEWKTFFFGEELESLNDEEQNLIVQAAQFTANTYDKVLPACRLEVESGFPLSKGMGSSASAIVAGIELADCLLDLQLSKKEKSVLACSLEKHPDNVIPAIYGGLTISFYNGKDVETVHVPDVAVEMIVAIPDEVLHTKESRKSLPNLLPFNKAVEASAISNVLVAALIKNDWEKAADMMKRDLFHEPFRTKNMPFYHELKEKAISLGAYGASISGSGPSIVFFTPHQKAAAITEQLAYLYPDYSFETVFPDRKGTVVNKSLSAAAL